MARLFDGVDDYIQCGGRLPLDNIPTSPLTFTLWIRKQGYGTEDTLTQLPSRLISRETFSLHPTTRVNILRGWALALTKTGAIEYTQHRREGDRYYLSPPIIPEDEWVYVCLTVVPGGSDIRLYTSLPADKTGVVEVQGGVRAEGAGTILNAVDMGMMIGVSHHDNTDASRRHHPFRAWYRGMLGDTRIYKRILSLSEMNEVRCGERPEPRPAAHYSMSSTGNVESDLSGNGNRGDVRGPVPAPPSPSVLCYGVTGFIPPIVEEPEDGSQGGADTPIPDGNNESNPPPGIPGSDDLVTAATGHRARTQYRCIRGRKPGHSSRHGGRYH